MSAGRMRRPPYYRWRRVGNWRAWLVIALALLIWKYYDAGPEPAAPPPAEGLEQQFTVEHVVDGDTLKLVGGARVRLIGVDTPETVKPDTPVQPFGPEASAFTRDFVDHHQVRLQFDRERTDQYGRWLAHVWVGDRLLNEELLRAGLARWEPHYHYSATLKSRYRKAEAEARAEKRGIWSLE